LAIQGWIVDLFIGFKKKQSEVNTSSSCHKEFQKKKEKIENKGSKIKNRVKYKSNVNNSANFTYVQGPSS
jgi:hypothetical protein